MSAQDGQTGDTFRWYTHVRKFPQLIGKTPDGRRIWGGPYTQTQVIVTATIVFVGASTRDMWGRFGLFGDFCALLALAATVGFVIGRMPIGMRNPVGIAADFWRAMTSPGMGRYRGAPVRTPRRHRSARLTRSVVVGPRPHLPLPAEHVAAATTDLQVRSSTADPVQPVAAATRPEQASPSGVADSPVLMTGVQRLLAGVPKE